MYGKNGRKWIKPTKKKIQNTQTQTHTRSTFWSHTAFKIIYWVEFESKHLVDDTNEST